MSRLVSNTSPLIVLARAGLLDLLPRLFSEVLIPAAVRAEILAGPDGDNRFGPRRKSGARPLRGLAALSHLATLRGLRVNAVG